MKISDYLVHNSEPLKKAIVEHPDWPIVILANEDANIGDCYEMYCSTMSVHLSEYLDTDVPFSDNLFIDKDDFEEELTDWLFNYLELDYGCGFSEEWFEEQLEKELNKYKPFWKNCICLHVGN